MTPADATTLDIREQLITGALRMISDDGPVDLSVRKLAQAGNRSTMCVYTKFSSRQGLLHAVYERAGRQFLGALDAASSEGARVFAQTYRELAVADPGRYALLFEHSMADFDLSLDLRAELILQVRARLARALEADGYGASTASARAMGLWAAMHGLVQAQHTLAVADLPGSPETWPQNYMDLLFGAESVAGIENSPTRGGSG